MRLLHVVPSYLPAVRYGGPVHAVHGLCRALARAGHEVDVFTTTADGAGELAVPGARCVARDGVGVHYFPRRAPRRWFHSPALAAALARQVAGYDLVHVHALFLHPVGAAASAARRAGVPYLVSPRGMLVAELFARRSPLLKRGWLELVGRRLLEGAAAVHVTSSREADDVARFGLHLRRVLTVANGIEAVHASRLARDPSLLLFLGRLSWKKGLDRLLHALALLPGRTLVVAGNDEEGLTPSLHALARRLRIDDRVRFLGAVDGARKHELYARAGVFVLASDSENFANAALEAMAAGCPVVLTAAVGLADAVREARCGAVCGTAPGDIAAALARLLDDPPAAARMGRAGRELVRERFLWPQLARQMEQGYRELLAVHHGPGAAA